jgi:hypothetical protein
VGWGRPACSLTGNRQQHSIRLTIELVVKAVCSSKTLKHSNFFVSKQSKSLMDVNIVHDEISKAIGSDTDACWHECAQ